VQAAFGWTPEPTSAGDCYRSYENQERVFLQRYTPQATGSGPLGDVRFWNGVRYVRVTGAAAAVPGTSNHGWAIAVDVSLIGPFGGTRYDQFAAVAQPEGWSNREGMSVNEPWHWVFGSTPTNPTPNPSEEDEMNADQDARLRSIENTVATLSRRAPIILRCVDPGSGNNNQIAVVQGNGVHLLTPAEYNTLVALGYTITHDNLGGGPFAALVRAFGGWDA
jgi:hypothetical protein